MGTADSIRSTLETVKPMILCSVLTQQVTTMKACCGSYDQVLRAAFDATLEESRVACEQWLVGLIEQVQVEHGQLSTQYCH